MSRILHDLTEKFKSSFKLRSVCLTWSKFQVTTIDTGLIHLTCRCSQFISPFENRSIPSANFIQYNRIFLWSELIIETNELHNLTCFCNRPIPSMRSFLYRVFYIRCFIIYKIFIICVGITSKTNSGHKKTRKVCVNICYIWLCLRVLWNILLFQ